MESAQIFGVGLQGNLTFWVGILTLSHLIKRELILRVLTFWVPLLKERKFFFLKFTILNSCLSLFKN